MKDYFEKFEKIFKECKKTYEKKITLNQFLLLW